MILEGSIWSKIFMSILAILFIGTFIMKVGFDKWPWDKYLK